MRTIKDFTGKVCELSDGVFIIINDEHPSYKKGLKVHLIEHDGAMGGHFSSDAYVTVCRCDAPGNAEFCGIKKTALLQVFGPPIDLETVNQGGNHGKRTFRCYR